jgi:hypothetical protein
VTIGDVAAEVGAAAAVGIGRVGTAPGRGEGGETGECISASAA